MSKELGTKMKVNFVLIGLAHFILVPVGTSLRASEIPKEGRAYSMTDMVAIEYTCNAETEDRIACTFLHTYIRRLASQSRMEKYLAEFDGESAAKAITEEFCENMQDELELAESGFPVVPSKDNNVWANQRAIDGLRRLIRYCETKDQQALRKANRESLELDFRTCRVRSTATQWTFKRLAHKADKPASWISEKELSDECDSTERIVMEPFGGFRDEPMPFQLRMNVTVKNPERDFLTGTKCSILEVKDVVYTPNPNEAFRSGNCERIEFGF